MRYQPQAAARIGRHPITAGLRMAMLPGVNRGYDALNMRMPTVVGTKPVLVPVGYAGGFGAALGAGSTDRMVSGLNGSLPAAGRTYFFRGKRNGSGGSALGRLMDKSSGATGQMLYWYGSLGRLVYSIYTSGSERVTDIPTSNVSAAIGETFNVVLSHMQVGNVATLNCWLEGQQVLENTQVTGTFNDTTAFMSIGNRADSVRGWDGLIECAYAWDRILSPNEAVAISQNPYILYDDLHEEDFDYVVVNGVQVRALIVSNGQRMQVTDALIGTGKKPLVLIDGQVRERTGSEGTPVVFEDGRYRTLAPGEILRI